ncbi:MAG: hypothetical protein K0U66_09850 [Gammaproteobacteria bacterium]|nr:hypothetical protein [Pseudomonadota bacterium]MCH9663937.1 hypothetical protein [Gammaproteobacteria bacterium]
MDIPNRSLTTATGRTRLTHIKAGVGKLLSLPQATVRRLIPASAGERRARLLARLSLSYRLLNADDILTFLERHKYLPPLLDILPRKIRAIMSAEPETISSIDLWHFPDYGDGDDHLKILVNANINNVYRKLTVDRLFFAGIVEPLYGQARGRILIKVELS